MIKLHADDYGITPEQSRALIDLCSEGGSPGLDSMSIFANSPCFEEAAGLASPLVRCGDIDLSLHVNLVEGPSCADTSAVAPLVDGRGMMRNDFGGLLAKSLGPGRHSLHEAARAECSSQIRRFVEAFPEFRDSLRIDSHQHVHMIPVVFDAVVAAAGDNGCRIRQIRVPVEEKAAFARCGRERDITFSNNLKNTVLSRLSKSCIKKLPDGCSVPAFSGVLLSGAMDSMDLELASALNAGPSSRGSDLEILFHPVSVPVDECLDPKNTPFAQACASAGRDREAEAVRTLAPLVAGR